MKQRRSTRRKQFRQPPKRLPPAQHPRSTSGEIAALPRRASNAVLDPVGTAEGPLTLHEASDQPAFCLALFNLLPTTCTDLGILQLAFI
jgi:hypothetical protein